MNSLGSPLPYRLARLQRVSPLDITCFWGCLACTDESAARILGTRTPRIRPTKKARAASRRAPERMFLMYKIVKRTSVRVKQNRTDVCLQPLSGVKSCEHMIG